MVQGTLEVLLINAKGLDNTDFFFKAGKMDPYVILTIRSHEQKSSVASGQGSNPEWNETFKFSVSPEGKELRIRIMDSDTLTADDFVGETTISLDFLTEAPSGPPKAYRVVKDGNYCGEIKMGLTFYPQEYTERGFVDRSYGADEPAYERWEPSY